MKIYSLPHQKSNGPALIHNVFSTFLGVHKITLSQRPSQRFFHVISTFVQRCDNVILLAGEPFRHIKFIKHEKYSNVYTGVCNRHYLYNSGLPAHCRPLVYSSLQGAEENLLCLYEERHVSSNCPDKNLPPTEQSAQVLPLHHPSAGDGDNMKTKHKTLKLVESVVRTLNLDMVQVYISAVTPRTLTIFMTSTTQDHLMTPQCGGRVNSPLLADVSNSMLTTSNGTLPYQPSTPQTQRSPPSPSPKSFKSCRNNIPPSPIMIVMLFRSLHHP